MVCSTERVLKQNMKLESLQETNHQEQLSLSESETVLSVRTESGLGKKSHQEAYFFIILCKSPRKYKQNSNS